MRFGRVLLTLALALVGCEASPGPSGSATPLPPTASSPAAAPGPTPFVLPDLTPQGLGPYAVGAALNALVSTGLASSVRETPACPGIATAKGTASYGSPDLVFVQGKLESLRVTSPQVRTAEGLAVGQTGVKVRETYVAASDLNNGQGGRALIVQVGANALLFRLSTRDVVTSIDAGLADPLQFRFTDGEGC